LDRIYEEDIGPLFVRQAWELEQHRSVLAQLDELIGFADHGKMIRIFGDPAAVEAVFQKALALLR
jgi:hypothetical protein